VEYSKEKFLNLVDKLTLLAGSISLKIMAQEELPFCTATEQLEGMLVVPLIAGEFVSRTSPNTSLNSNIAIRAVPLCSILTETLKTIGCGTDILIRKGEPET
jgi:hypothetical protein